MISRTVRSLEKLSYELIRNVTISFAILIAFRIPKMADGIGWETLP